ncbi:hypothetical protein EDD15DRAFT_2198133 [Pisolithus albus]|nr:hypothetical protein EDD15DRAFT_2198133 [Pisolithus albus]
MYDLDAIRALHETAMASRTSLVEPTVSVFTKVTKRQKAPVVTLVKVNDTPQVAKICLHGIASKCPSRIVVRHWLNAQEVEESPSSYSESSGQEAETFIGG